ncbi:MAG TPA: protein-L-isoaspartate O-methyltransferase [Denitromonas sp.]|uniref:protein-L-isoaspartate O-methyltransferase family protein n=1 Tax=Denitromonas sp. TaxID=2734609 RepID=UPI001DA7E17B|nr:protein-L-isoaspartate O-methyltransferase [Rhodocyclaceae bacterium]HPR05706.1 protein-L-isoaspartate O-methyltransferase [Denitromonas sp.]HQU88926.1 protein-L-isoaspartate O-methyltransferase [Denitromonas sp.]HQV15082.1 protein-L-isoaspartate O-methyltransferase [Denitromonas sp.]
MDFERARFNMVEQQVRPWDVLDQDVLESMMTVKREEFVPAAHRALAFSEAEIPLGFGQVMVSPVIEGKVLQALALKPTDSVLEIGAGSGYFAALLASRADWVRSIEIEPELAALASANLKAAGVENAVVEEGDGSDGWPSRAPYDVIVVSGGMPELPASLKAQLKVGGRLFAFIGEAPMMVGRLVTCIGEGQYESVDVFENVVPALRNARRADAFRF